MGPSPTGTSQVHRQDEQSTQAISVLVLTACSVVISEDVQAMAHVAVHALTPSSTRGLLVEVSGPDIDAPLHRRFPVEADRIVRGSVAVSPGAVRRIAITAVAEDERPTHHGAVTLPLLPGGHPPMHVLLAPVP